MERNYVTVTLCIYDVDLVHNCSSWAKPALHDGCGIRVRAQLTACIVQLVVQPAVQCTRARAGICISGSCGSAPADWTSVPPPSVNHTHPTTPTPAPGTTEHAHADREDDYFRSRDYDGYETASSDDTEYADAGGAYYAPASSARPPVHPHFTPRSCILISQSTSTSSLHSPPEVQPHFTVHKHHSLNQSCIFRVVQ